MNCCEKRWAISSQRRGEITGNGGKPLGAARIVEDVAWRLANLVENFGGSQIVMTGDQRSEVEQRQIVPMMILRLGMFERLAKHLGDDAVSECRCLHDLPPRD